ncbi:triose-phosphate isomerase [Hydrogenimonas thermophila]|uniref:Triosephosphate isomerase n=1 Tax=Hydrogenimonas thermophila TaxID=223786 RepID=A0A1I5PAB1_9BACT|nr:triose-phosphate isomerase [Hydrogenimonas thermophila]WOE69656.1 triose-phosphate isomerase [Hydrogenimonas thermophila]WOE72170.1 triose-phosphate isomerase [Hydrogenimonas thermophila]SFP30913.1 triosephosphate isomerase [Hydrogenimonas thermophila]
MSKILAANFKTNHTRASTQEYVEKLDTSMGELGYLDDLYLFPPATALNNFNVKNSIHIGAQNAYPTIKGSFTGEIGVEQLEEFNVKTLLIGHSERRHILGETQEFIAKKYIWFIEKGFKIFYCIGEPLEVREAGDKAVRQYLVEQLEGIDTSYENLILAYEPVWAIGTGKTATAELIERTHSMIKEMVDKPLLYGGSVKPQNLAEILAVPGCDGALIGTASWDAESMISMLEIAKNID